MPTITQTAVEAEKEEEGESQGSSFYHVPSLSEGDELLYSFPVVRMNPHLGLTYYSLKIYNRRISLENSRPDLRITIHCPDRDQNTGIAFLLSQNHSNHLADRLYETFHGQEIVAYTEAQMAEMESEHLLSEDRTHAFIDSKEYLTLEAIAKDPRTNPLAVRAKGMTHARAIYDRRLLDRWAQLYTND